MTMLEWLNNHATHFPDLTPEERDAIAQFTMLWGSVEGPLFQNDADEGKISGIADQIRDKIVIADFHEHITYFHHRYLVGDGHERLLETLHLSRGAKSRVLRVLREEETDPARIVDALLLIVYRFRNNLFHGLKWAEDIRGQASNFEHAGKIVMKVFALRFS